MEIFSKHLYCLDCGRDRTCPKTKAMECSLFVYYADLKKILDSKVLHMKREIHNMREEGIIGKVAEIKLKEKADESFSEDDICVFCEHVIKDWRSYRGKRICKSCYDELKVTPQDS